MDRDRSIRYALVALAVVGVAVLGLVAWTMAATTQAQVELADTAAGVEADRGSGGGSFLDGVANWLVKKLK